MSPGGECQGRPQVYAVAEDLKVAGHHSYNHRFAAIDQNSLARDLGIAAIPALPETIAEEDCTCSTGSCVSILKCPAEPGSYAQNGEEVGCHCMIVGLLGLTISRDTGSTPDESSHSFKDAILITHIEVSGRSHV